MVSERSALPQCKNCGRKIVFGRWAGWTHVGTGGRDCGLTAHPAGGDDE
jgi:hypothetical protein